MRPPSTLLQLNAILVLFCAAAMLFTNKADGQQQDTLGLGGLPIPAVNGKIDLPSGTKLIKRANLADYKIYNEEYNGTFKPCNLDIDEHGNIEVFYDEVASTSGCTVDLLFAKMDQIEFVAKMEDKEEPKCVTEYMIDNLLPFIFNEANNGLAALTNGPEYGGDDDCIDKTECERFNSSKCIKRTMFQFGWRTFLRGIKGHIEQVGEPMENLFYSTTLLVEQKATMDVKMAVGDISENSTWVEIRGKRYRSLFPSYPPYCNHPREATPPPAIWKVKSGEFKDKYFVTFHFFPQKAARIYGFDRAPIGGPKCKGPKQLSFVFPKDFTLGILAIPKPKTTTAKSTIGSTTPNGTTTTGPEPGSTEAGGLSIGAWY